jgi:hypothetical protein
MWREAVLESPDLQELSFILLSAVDTLTTWAAIQIGCGAEGNSLIAPLTSLGLGFIAFKVLAALLFIVACRIRGIQWAIAVGAFMELGIVVWNSLVMMHGLLILSL